MPDPGFNGKSMILNRLFKTRETPQKPLYAAIVAAARQHKFYETMGVADTIEGRLEMLVLHLFLVLERLKNEGVEELRQNLTDEFFNDMDGTLRELGVSDVTVGKKVRKIAESYYGRILAYDKAIKAGATELEDALARNVYAEAVSSDFPKVMAAYVQTAVDMLASLPTQSILRSELKFP